MYSYNNKNWDCVFGFFKHACDCNANLMIWTEKMGRVIWPQIVHVKLFTYTKSYLIKLNSTVQKKKKKSNLIQVIDWKNIINPS
jgi:hypothetical protein